METTLLTLGGLAIVDSINPSAIVVALHLLDGQRPAPKVLAYLAGVFSSYLALGVLLVLGFGAAISRWRDALWSPPAYAVQLAIGVIMLVYAIKADPRPGDGRLERLSGAKGFAALFALGIAVTVWEFSSAVPYFAATGILGYADLGLIVTLAILVGYNLIFVAPPLALLGLHRRLGARSERLRERLQRAGREAALWIIGIVGFHLALDALMFFDFLGMAGDGPHRSPLQTLLEGLSGR
ncbi:MAG: GAP family protein [Actinomycetes bacterium]|jgi:cytochrome c biogenesis protein CcdA|nr:MAG: hypothetical protein DIU67_01355 [Actinomycetota bacterium]